MMSISQPFSTVHVTHGHCAKTHWLTCLQSLLSPCRQFKHSFDPSYSFVASYVCSPTVEWYWYVWLMPTMLKVISVLLLIFSLVVVWSEVTFFSIEPELSLFAIVINAAVRDYNYLCIEVCNNRWFSLDLTPCKISHLYGQWQTILVTMGNRNLLFDRKPLFLLLVNFLFPAYFNAPSWKKYAKKKNSQKISIKKCTAE